MSSMSRRRFGTVALSGPGSLFLAGCDGVRPPPPPEPKKPPPLVVTCKSKLLYDVDVVDNIRVRCDLNLQPPLSFTDPRGPGHPPVELRPFSRWFLPVAYQDGEFLPRSCDGCLCVVRGKILTPRLKPTYDSQGEIVALTPRCFYGGQDFPPSSDHNVLWTPALDFQHGILGGTPIRVIVIGLTEWLPGQGDSDQLNLAKLPCSLAPPDFRPDPTGYVIPFIDCTQLDSPEILCRRGDERTARLSCGFVRPVRFDENSGDFKLTEGEGECARCRSYVGARAFGGEMRPRIRDRGGQPKIIEAIELVEPQGTFSERQGERGGVYRASAAHLDSGG